MVISLWESQSAYLKKNALKAMESSLHRIFAVSLVHQKLYQSDKVKTVDMPIYLPEFISYLGDSLVGGRFIHFNPQRSRLIYIMGVAIKVAQGGYQKSKGQMNNHF
jgi:two-component sensor histidine kinase